MSYLIASVLFGIKSPDLLTLVVNVDVYVRDCVRGMRKVKIDPCSSLIDFWKKTVFRALTENPTERINEFFFLYF